MTLLEHFSSNFVGSEAFGRQKTRCWKREGASENNV
jgi:hypothetical protein